MRILTPFVCAALVGSSTLWAHGGVYRGPGEVQPPAATSSGSASTGTTTPTSGGGTTGSGGSAQPSAPGSPGSGPALLAGPVRRGSLVGGDPTRWVYWWEFHKDSILHLREALDKNTLPAGSDDLLVASGRDHDLRPRLRPTHEEVRDLVVPALQRALERSESRDLTSSCLVALAKIGSDGKDAATLPLLRMRLQSPDQEVRETAALALGISRRNDAFADLLALASDDTAGRVLVARSEVDERTRSFATYGLALLAEQATVHRRMQIVAALGPWLAAPGKLGRDLTVAVVHALRLAVPDHTSSGDDPVEATLRADIVKTLSTYVQRDLGPGEQLMQAHALLALAEAMGPGITAEHQKLKELCLREIGGGGARRAMPSLSQSAALALGKLFVVGKDDTVLGDALFQCARSGKDLATRRFALIALSQVGTPAIEKRLLEMLATDATHIERSWIVLGLGMIARDRRLADKPVAATLAPMLRKELQKARDPEYLGALTIAIGLARIRDAAPDLVALLRERAQENDLVGQVCTALALLGHQESEAEIGAIVERSVRRPEVMARAAVALGKLGSKDVTDVLIRHLTECEGDGSLVRLGANAQALGLVGDRRCLEPLLALLADGERPPLARAFAAVALGNVCDDHALPWNASLARGINYLATVETLYDQVAGVLDIF